MYYLYRNSPTHKWNIAKEPKGSEVLKFKTWKKAKAERKARNEALTSPKNPVGRPWPEDHRKGTRVFFTLNADIIDKIPGDGSAKDIKTFCKSAAIEKANKL